MYFYLFLLPSWLLWAKRVVWFWKMLILPVFVYQKGTSTDCAMHLSLVGVSRPIPGPVGWTEVSRVGGGVQVSGVGGGWRTLSGTCFLPELVSVTIKPLLPLARVKTTEIKEDLDRWSGTVSRAGPRTLGGNFPTKPIAISHLTLLIFKCEAVRSSPFKPVHSSDVSWLVPFILVRKMLLPHHWWKTIHATMRYVIKMTG